MDRLACVEVPALPLQLLLSRHPDWAALPVAVVDEDKPQGLVLWANRPAREAGVKPGLRYGPALSLAPRLRADTVSDAAVAEAVGCLMERLYGFSPELEPAEREPGVFWLDAGGLMPLFASFEAWAHELRRDLAACGYVAAVVVGFRRFGTYAVARRLRGRRVHVFETPEAEAAAAQRVPLALLGLPPGERAALAQLGVQDVGGFLALPAHGVGRRFGAQALALHRFASGELEWPLAPTPRADLLEAHQALEYGEASAERLVFMVKPLVDGLLVALREREQALAELWLRFALDGAPERLERIRPAAPTLSSVTVMELVQLRLAGAPLGAPALAVTAGAVMAPASPDQLRMFAEHPTRDVAAAARAFARLRAAFGSEDVVARASLRDRHLPEGRFGWEPLWGIERAQPGPASGALVRRLLERPEPLTGATAQALERWLRTGRSTGPIAQLTGPHRFTGGWWRAEIERDYYFAELRSGELLWVYFDGVRQGWFVHGEIS